MSEQLPDPELDYRDTWEQLFDKHYLRWFHLQGREVVVEIEKVEKDVELTMRGGIKSKKPVIHFVGKDKPLVLNVTNCTSIADICGTKPSKWPGQKVCLYPTSTRMYDVELKKMKTVGCIRIKAAGQEARK